MLRQRLCSLCVRWVARVARLRATAHALSGEEAQLARLRRAHAAPRWLESAHILLKATAPAGRPSPSVHGRASTCQPRPQNEKLTCVRAQVKQRNRVRSLSLSGGSAARALATCARPAALVGVGPYPMEARCDSGTAVSLNARTCLDVPVAASKREAYLRACASQKVPTARAHSLSAGSAARALATCARRAALVGIGPYSIEAHCASGTAVSLGARPCCDVRILVLTW